MTGPMYDAYCTGHCLPETGLPIWVLVGGGLVIIALGVALWWLDRPR